MPGNMPTPEALQDYFKLVWSFKNHMDDLATEINASFFAQEVNKMMEAHGFDPIPMREPNWHAKLLKFIKYLDETSTKHDTPS